MAQTFLNLAQGVTGTLPTSNYVGGKVLQAVTVTHASQTSTTSTDWTDTGLTCNITPSATSSKILVMISQQAAINRASSLARGKFRVVRDSTVIFGAASWSINMQQTGGDLAHSTMLSFNELDSPSSTSALTFKTQMQAESGTNIVSCQSGHDSTIILMEIAA